jgi:chemotaxis protein MotB
MRRRKHAEHVNHERWLVSYADFITLLFAFFVVMFASGQTDRDKAKQVAESVREGFTEQNVAKAVTRMLGGPVRKLKEIDDAKQEHPASGSGEPADLAKAYEDLRSALSIEIGQGSISLDMDPRGLVISLKEAGFFASGGAETPDQAVPSLTRIAQALQPLPNQIRLEGHTDPVPISNGRFSDNWELSSARAIAMLHFLVAQGMKESRFVVMGYADSAPVSPNETPEGRARNRRVDIVVLNYGESADAPSWGKSRSSKPLAAN